MVYVCFECGSDTKSDPDSYLVQLFLGLYSDTGFSFQGFTSVVCKVRANILVCHSASIPMIGMVMVRSLSPEHCFLNQYHAKLYGMKRLLPVLMGFVVLLGMQQAQAFDPEDLKRLKETNECRQCDLQGANLQGTNLFGADLIGANLEGAKLRAADLQEADLMGTNFKGANLSDADLQRAHLRRAKLQGANLQGANLQGTHPLGTNFGGANLQGANLQRVDLAATNLQGANLQGADLRNADLLGTNLQGTDLRD